MRCIQSFDRRALMCAAAGPRCRCAGTSAAAVGGDASAPPLSLIDLDGKTWDLSALQGRAVLLNFWATWCEPCREEMPSLEALAKRASR